MIKKAQDVQNDNSHAVLYKIAKAIDFKLPEYVETGVPLTKEAAASTTDMLFADVQNRRYPITDRANTWLSGAYFAKTAADAYSDYEYRRIAGRIMKAASLYGIENDVMDVMQVLISQKNTEKQASAEDMQEFYGEPETNGFPMFNKTQTKQACSYFDKNAYAYDWKRRATIAKNILKRAAVHGIEVPEVVRKEAGAGFPRRDFLAENLLTRESELDRQGLHKLAGDMRRTIKIVCEASPEDLMDKLEMIREIVSRIDEFSGMHKDYGRKFLPPADFIFDNDDDEAKEFQEDSIPFGNEVLSAKALSELPKKLFSSILSPTTLAGMCDHGKLCPKKMSVTIIKMAPRDKNNLLNVIKDFTSNAGMPFKDDSEDSEEYDDNENYKSTDKKDKKRREVEEDSEDSE